MKSYSQHFQSYRKDVSEKARQYASGLMQAGARKNLERMCEVVPEAKHRNLQQFLTHSKWDAREVMDHVARDTNELLGDELDASLVIDESGFAKQGPKSVGVSRQWLGRLGKVDNGQVAVFGVLARDRWVVPVDTRFYLPQKWVEDVPRCQKAGVPETERVFRTKPELALEIIRHAREIGLQFGWTGMDAGYGKNAKFLFEIEDIGVKFMVDLHCDFMVHLEKPEVKVDRKRGRPARSEKVEVLKEQEKPIEVGKLIAGLSETDWQAVSIRDTTRGNLERQAYSRSVWVKDRETQEIRQYLVLATRSLNGSDIKYSMTNVAQDTSLQRLAWMQSQRYWVERSFEDGKGECGMADYQVRKWKAWHHHMALVMMVMLFMLQERMLQKENHPLLSCADIEDLLVTFLPRRDTDPADVFARIEARHRQRLKAIESHRRRNQLLVENGSGKSK